MFGRFQIFLDSFRDLKEQSYEVFLGKPSLLLGQQLRKVGSMFRNLPAAPAATIYGGVLWVVPLAMAGPYLSLYMVSLGLTETEVGVYQSLAKLIGPLGWFVGGYFSDVWGRKKALVFFDIVTWGGYCLCLALATDKWWCIGAILFMAANAASGPAYQCLLIEGTSPRTRSLAYTVGQIANLLPYLLFAPLLGYFWVSQRGFKAANHEMYWFFLVMVLVGVWIRWKFVPASRVYEKTPGTWFRVFEESLRQYWRAFRHFFKKPVATPFLVSKFLDEWFVAMWGYYYSLYFVHRLGLRDASLSVLAQGSAYSAFFILFVVMPHITGKRVVRFLGLDQWIGLAALGLLLGWGKAMSPFTLGLLVVGLVAISGVFYNSVSAAIWMNVMTEKERAKVVAVSMGFVTIGIAFSGSLGSFLYNETHPEVLFWVMAGMKLLNFFLLRHIARLLGKTGSIQG